VKERENIKEGGGDGYKGIRRREKRVQEMEL
jgi:hypothetical protein